MSKNQQITKNIELSEKLAEYISDNPSEIRQFPSSVSYVTFSSTDERLNSANKKLVLSLKSEGKSIIKAQETKDKKNPWKFILLSS